MAGVSAFSTAQRRASEQKVCTWKAVVGLVPGCVVCKPCLFVSHMRAPSTFLSASLLPGRRQRLALGSKRD